MTDLRFYDAACRIGKNQFNEGTDVPGILKEMDRCGIEKALVRDLGMPKHGAVTGNKIIVDMLKKDDPDHRLTGVWCLLPEQCEELLPPAEFFDTMEQNNIRAVTLMPFDHRWTPCRLTIKNYMAEALTRRVPVLLDGFGDAWEVIQNFLLEFPENIFISIENSGKWGIDRRIRPLMDAFKNLYFSIDGYWVPEGIPGLVRRYGADRFVFGSRFPKYVAGSAMLQLKHAGLSDEDMKKIASGNLEKLLKGASK